MFCTGLTRAAKAKNLLYMEPNESTNFFPISVIKKDPDEHKFCPTLIEKTVGRIEIQNSNLNSDQFLFSVHFLFIRFCTLNNLFVFFIP